MIDSPPQLDRPMCAEPSADVSEFLRTEGVGRMIAFLAHESRNALQRIAASSDMLARRLRDYPEAACYVHQIHRAVDDLGHLFTEVRGPGGAAPSCCSTCDLLEVWRDAWEQVEPARTGRAVQMVRCLEDSVGHCAGDRWQLTQVFRNLFENSLAACSDPVRIELHGASIDLASGPGLRVVYRDNGPGIEPDERQRIFEPFHSTKPSGMGLGLSICRWIVEAHGGTIELGNPYARGAEFVITLPPTPG